MDKAQTNSTIAPEAISKVPNGQQTFYRRPLPPSTCIAFESPLGRKMFKEALEEGTMETYFSLASNFVTQGDPATCGLGALSMVLNSLEMDPDRIWKGAWRWYSEDMLDCCSPMDEIKQNGLTLDELACTAICNGAAIDKTRVHLFDPNDAAEWEALENAFRDTVRSVSKSTDRKLIASYHRGTLLQTGTGHFSPIGGYHAASDQVLIFDVARFKYPPHWVPLKLLVKSMTELDPSNGLARGYFVVQRSSSHIGAVLRVTVGKSQWKQLADAYSGTLAARTKNVSRFPVTNLLEYLQLSCGVLGDTQVMEYLVQYVDSLQTLASEHRTYIQQIFEEISKTTIGKTLHAFPQPCCTAYSRPGYLQVAAIFIFAQGPVGIQHLEPAVADSIHAAFIEILPTELEKEVQSLQSTLQAISYICCCRKGETSSNGLFPIQSPQSQSQTDIVPSKQVVSCSGCRS